MTWRDIVPLVATMVGTVVGWVLARLAQKTQDEREDKRVLRRAIVGLLRAHDLVMNQAEALIVEIDCGEGHPTFESYTTILAEAAAVQLVKLADEVCEIDPILGYDLHYQRELSERFAK